MCRFLCYRGPDLLLADLLYRPANSLIRQSYKPRELAEILNGDGFGVGWYSPAVTETPCVFTSITPAWSNQNLRRLAEHVTSTCFFAHVRAASPGMRVYEENCHPFQYGRYLWMHNGTVGGFAQLKRRLRRALPDPLYDAVQGTTDSEHAFAVFLALLPRDRACEASDLGRALADTIRTLEAWRAEARIDEPSYCNFAVTDGENIATVRYVSDPKLEPVSLYFSEGVRYRCHGDTAVLEPAPPGGESVVVASERLTDRRADWVRVAPNHVLTVSRGLEVRVDLLDL